jgi:hypothetical protein
MGQTAPVLSVAGGGSSAAFWYLGPYQYPGCCSDSYPEEYWTEWALYLTPNGSGTVQYHYSSTGSGTLNFLDQSSSGATMQSISASTPGVYDITVWATVGGVASNSISIYIDKPSFQTNTGNGLVSAGACPTGTHGYLGSQTYWFYDINGGALDPGIDTAETLENWKTTSNWGTPSQVVWTPAYWSDNTIIDYVGFCPENGEGEGPMAQTWNSSGTSLVATITQKFWFGDSDNDFEGYCTQEDKLTWYTDHSVISNITSPVSQASCDSGQYIN